VKLGIEQDGYYLINNLRGRAFEQLTALAPNTRIIIFRNDDDNQTIPISGSVDRAAYQTHEHALLGRNYDVPELTIRSGGFNPFKKQTIQFDAERSIVLVGGVAESNWAKTVMKKVGSTISNFLAELG